MKVEEDIKTSSSELRWGGRLVQYKIRGMERWGGTHSLAVTIFGSILWHLLFLAIFNKILLHLSDSVRSLVTLDTSLGDGPVTVAFWLADRSISLLFSISSLFPLLAFCFKWQQGEISRPFKLIGQPRAKVQIYPFLASFRTRFEGFPPVFPPFLF